MRKAQKKQAEEFVELLGQVHKEIKGAILSGDILEAQELLTQCQQGAIALGDLIETTEGEGFVTIPYLEDYCEKVYQVYQKIEAGMLLEFNALYDNLQRALLAVAQSVKIDIHVRKEVVFLPYKASMWDSLESVYLAAKEDKDCDAYCIPIPYYDRNPDGSLGQMHYEGKGYPSNIEIISWQQYSLEERRPDIIYIHNAYDDWNLVTCVHPAYFSSRLKKYTDMLVYIPYFVLQELEPRNQAMIEQMKHFCFLPGIVHADRVIVQSENMRQIYMQEYKKEARARGMAVEEGQLEKKILGLGSPKFDRIADIQKEKLEIPDSWRRIIQRPDGTRKKIILYNNSVVALLHSDEKMIKKMKNVFQTFYKHREKAVLLWRPHPLIEATLTSMRPMLWNTYKEVRDCYLREGWGIYDDSSDLDRAMVLSDGYYGDSSSVVELFLKQGKPAMIQDVNCLE